MLFNYTTHFLVLYYFHHLHPKSERSERGIETFSILFLYFYFLYFSKKKKNTNVRNPLSPPHFYLFFLQKDGGKSEKHNRLFQFPTAFSNQPTN